MSTHPKIRYLIAALLMLATSSAFAQAPPPPPIREPPMASPCPTQEFTVAFVGGVLGDAERVKFNNDVDRARPCNVEQVLVTGEAARASIVEALLIEAGIFASHIRVTPAQSRGHVQVTILFR